MKELEAYYRSLGYTENQSKLLGGMTYSGYDTISMVESFESSTAFATGCLFEDSVESFKQSDAYDKYKESLPIDKLYKLWLNTPEKMLDKRVKEEIKEANHFRIPSYLKGCKPRGVMSMMNMAPQRTEIKGEVELDEVVDMDEVDDIDEICCEESDALFCCQSNNISFAEAPEGGFLRGMSFSSMQMTGAPASIPGAIGRTEGAGAIYHEKLAECGGMINVQTTPTSTFRTTCNTASADDIIYGRLGGNYIDRSAVRIEEFLNWYDFKLENNDRPVSITTALKRGKDNKSSQKLFIGLKGKDYVPAGQNIVILLDVSGSMVGSEKEVQAAIFTIISKLGNFDRLSLITYSSTDEIVLNSVIMTGADSGNRTDRQLLMSNIIRRIMKIEINGSTYGSKGLETAYDLIKANKIEDGVNRIILITDGDFNFGDCNTDTLKEKIYEYKKSGAYISIVGAGHIQGNDAIMETLARNGNGNYCTIKTLKSVDRNINKKYASLVYTIATDVKAQVEFNPKYVKSYKLIGYENRRLNHDDFKNDKVVSEPFCSGSQCVAVYEIERTYHPSYQKEVNEGLGSLKYQRMVLIDNEQTENELCTVSIRYKKSLTSKVEEEYSSVSVDDETDSDVRVDKAEEIIDLCNQLRANDSVETSMADKLAAVMEG